MLEVEEEAVMVMVTGVVVEAGVVDEVPEVKVAEVGITATKPISVARAEAVSIP